MRQHRTLIFVLVGLLSLSHHWRCGDHAKFRDYWAVQSLLEIEAKLFGPYGFLSAILDGLSQPFDRCPNKPDHYEQMAKRGLFEQQRERGSQQPLGITIRLDGKELSLPPTTDSDIWHQKREVVRQPGDPGIKSNIKLSILLDERNSAGSAISRDNFQRNAAGTRDEVPLTGGQGSSKGDSFPPGKSLNSRPVYSPGSGC